MHRRSLLLLAAAGATLLAPWHRATAAARWPTLAAAADLAAVPPTSGAAIAATLDPPAVDRLCDRQELRLRAAPLDPDRLRAAIAEDFRRRDHYDVVGVRCAALELALLAVAARRTPAVWTGV